MTAVVSSSLDVMLCHASRTRAACTCAEEDALLEAGGAEEVEAVVDGDAGWSSSPSCLELAASDRSVIVTATIVCTSASALLLIRQ